MIRTLLATTAIVSLVATGAFAADNAMKPAATDTTTTTQDNGTAKAAEPAGMKSASEVKAKDVSVSDAHLASNLIGKSVYNSADDNGKNIGDVNDLVIGNDGAVKSVIVGVGGFLGIGEKNVALDYKQVTWQQRNGDWWVVVPTTTDQLKALPDFDRTAYNAEPASTVAGADNTSGGMAPATTTTAPAATDTTATAPAATTTTAPAKTDSNMASNDNSSTGNAATTDNSETAAIDKSKLTEMDTAKISANDFVGTTVYGADDAKVGSINDVVLDQDGKVDAVVIDAGGFLGIAGRLCFLCWLRARRLRPGRDTISDT